MYLVDTNVWLEHLLAQEKAGTVARFLDEVPSEHLFISDFSFHSVGVILSKLGKLDALARFVQDAFVDGSVTLLHLQAEDTERVVSRIRDFGLDFDDAYQYVTAEKHGLILISFDGDFDQTERGRKGPLDVLS